MIDPETKRYLDDLLQGRTTALRTFDLTTGAATSTVVTCVGMSSNAVVTTQAYSALSSNADIVRIVPAKDQFTVTHTASANARTHRYVWHYGLPS